MVDSSSLLLRRDGRLRRWLEHRLETAGPGNLISERHPGQEVHSSRVEHHQNVVHVKRCRLKKSDLSPSSMLGRRVDRWQQEVEVAWCKATREEGSSSTSVQKVSDFRRDPLCSRTGERNHFYGCNAMDAYQCSAQPNAVYKAKGAEAGQRTTVQHGSVGATVLQ